MRLQEVSVGGLFDQFDHRIPLKLDERITIVTGPNGFGKTMILRLLHAFFNQSPSKLAGIPFRMLQLAFDSGLRVRVERPVATQGQNEQNPKPGLIFSHEGPGYDPRRIEIKTGIQREELRVGIAQIEDLISELDQIGPETWRHLGTRETLSLDDVLERYGDELSRPDQDPESRLPEVWQTIRRSIPVGFITTDRLYVSGEDRSRRRAVSASGAYWVSSHSGRSHSGPAVERYSRELGERVKEALTQYGALSQSLDRTFPARLVAETESVNISMETLRVRLNAIEAKRKLLVEAGLLAEEQDVSVPQQVDPTKRGVLLVYATDAERKLGVFDDLFRKADLFKRIVNARFLYKRLAIGQSGFHVITSRGSSLKPELLSSGEQHELVLLYELLFRVKSGSLILIDEPEISLHVAWQKDFLSDLGQMAELSKFDALIATHSPQIIGDRDDLMVELKGPAA